MHPFFKFCVHVANEIQDDKVSEYDFTNEEDDVEDDDKDIPAIFVDDSPPIIVLSSDDDEHAGHNPRLDKRVEEHSGIDTEPWRTMIDSQCAVLEMSFSELPKRPVGGGWQDTELYQEKKDENMERYDLMNPGGSQTCC